MNTAKPRPTLAMRLLSAPLLALTIAACGGADDPDWSANVALSVATTPLAGVIGGVPWELSVAKADAQLSNESELFVMAYSDTPSTSCGVHISATSFALLAVRRRSESMRSARRYLGIREARPDRRVPPRRLHR